MKKNILVLLSLSALWVLPNLVFADCVSLGRVTGWYAQGEDTIIYHSRNTPVAKIVLQDCTVSSSSDIRPAKSYLCDEDTLWVDGQECAIMSLTSASSGSL